jgi:hypothetical protein
MPAIDGDPTVPDRDRLVRRLSDPDGIFGIPAESVSEMIVTGGPAALAGRMDALRAVGAQRVVVSFAAGEFDRQADLLAEATALLE